MYAIRFSLILVVAISAIGVNAQELAMTVDATKTGQSIHPYVYGQFTELLFNLFERGLWAEMLSDRKFFYPVDSSAELNPINRKRNFDRWRPVGPDEFVTMDHERAYVGEHAPIVKLEGQIPHGIVQAGLVLRKDRSYTGRIFLSGDPGVKIEISLIWGPDPGDRQTISIDSLLSQYKKYPLNFIAGVDTDNGKLEIIGTGTGSFRIGVVSLMPADNINGFRTDMVDLLRELKPGIYRWSGGNFVSGYEWRDGIGDIDKRPPRYDYAWNTVEYNDVGTDEFMTLCRLLGIDAYICVNAGFGDAHSAAQWVEYVNGSINTPTGKLRAANGHPAPYNVTWWGIGNEMYGQWQLGHMYINQYVLKHNMFAKAMRQVDPTIEIVASGATVFETGTTARHHRTPLPAKLPYEYGTPQDWSGNLLEKSSDYFGYLAEHLYPVADSAFDVNEQKFIRVEDPLVDRVRRIPNRVRCTIEAWKEYLKRMPHLKDKNIKLAIDEWAGGERMGFTSTLCAAEGLHEMFRHSDIIKMAAYTAFTSCLAFNGADSCYSATGLEFYLYRHRFGTIPVGVTGNYPQHPVKGTIGVDKPSVTSGSDTYPLDVVAALTDDRKSLTVAVVNPTESAQNININFKNIELRDKVVKWEIAADDLRAQNVAEQEPQIGIVESSIDREPKILEVAPLSVNLYKFDIR
jgi:alpha-N-arabinofuranosidase